MLRPSLTTAAAVMIGAVAMAQGDLRSRLQPVTGPIKHAGVYHLGTGTWTRNATVANVTGPDTIYNNTCNVTYFGGMALTENWAHRSAVPSPNHPTVGTVVPGGTRNDEAPGCATSYLVNGFQFEYCSNSLTTVGYELAFQNNYTLCGGGPMVPPAASTFVITGLPGGTTTATQNCWIIDVDLNAATLSFTLLADGTGTYFAPCTVDQFGARWTRLSGPPATNTDGPIIAGNLTWLGGTATGPLTPCSGTDGTIWDSPINLAEQGTGMCSSDFFRADGATPAPSGPGCYFFGGNPRGDFHLELYSAAGCGPIGPGLDFCEPGVSGVGTCVCGNPNSGTGNDKGCDNTGAGADSGAELDSAGTASVASDATDPGTVTLTVSSALSGSSCIHLQGNALLAAGTPFGAGIRCTGGSLKRLYIKPLALGSSTVPQGADQSITNRSAALGDVIAASSTRWYQTYYRDPSLTNPGGACPAIATFNISAGQEIAWGP